MDQVALVIYMILISYFLVLNLFYAVMLFFSFAGSLRNLYETEYTDYELISTSYLTIPISVLIPAHNEEVGIVDSVHAAAKSEYPEFEVVVVNDGSSDRTLDTLIEEFECHPIDVFYRQQLLTQPIKRIYRSHRYSNLWVIDKDNGGKADAINAGTNFASYRYLCMIDADCVMHPQGLLNMMREVSVDPGHLVSIGGQIRVGNGLEIEKGEIKTKRLPPGLIPKLQVVEYLGAFLGNRVGWSEINSVIVISGGFGLWRRDTVIEMGGMTASTTHEDIEFTFRVHAYMRENREPYQVAFIPDPIVWTEVPDGWRGLFRQRERWQRVVNEVFWLYRRMLFNPSYGTMGMVAMPYLLFYEILGPFIEVASYLFIIALLIAGNLSLNMLLLFLIISFGLTTSLRIASVFVEQYSFRTYPVRVIPLLFVLSVLENLGYRQFVGVARIAAFFNWLRGEKSWARVERRGFIPVGARPVDVQPTSMGPAQENFRHKT